MTNKQIAALKRENKRLKTINEGFKQGATKESQIQLANAFKKDLKKSASSEEFHLMKLLTEIRYRFEFQKIIYTNPSFIILDFCLPDENIVIEVDGAQHFKSDKLASDKNRDSYLKKMGYRTLRLSNAKVRQLNPDSLRKLLRDFKNYAIYKKVKEYKDYEILTFGKYQGLSIKEVYNLDRNYLVWMYRTLLGTFSKELKEKLLL